MGEDLILTVESDGSISRIAGGPLEEPISTAAPSDNCECGDFVADSSGDAGCGNCGADNPPVVA